uniref:AP-4 complex subunit epsilon n=1 Tax=Lygus hesperus TaxID=30085 RepID=A0A0A9ZES5_LYGHE
MFIVQLASVQSEREKRLGYLCVAQMLGCEPELQILLTNLFSNDLNVGSSAVICMALHTLTCILNPMLLSVLTPRLSALLSHRECAVRRRAVLCIHRGSQLLGPAIVLQVVPPEIAEKLATDVDPATVNALCILLQQIPPHRRAVYSDRCLTPLSKYIQTLIYRRVHGSYNYVGSAQQQPLAAPWFLLNALTTLNTLAVGIPDKSVLVACVGRVLDVLEAPITHPLGSTPTINALHIAILLRLAGSVQYCGIRSLVQQASHLLQKVVSLHAPT